MIKNLSNEPIPDRMRGLPIWNGFPIPYFTMIAEGEPQWPVLDAEHVLDCMLHERCDICNQPLVKGYYHFIGGERSIAHGMFVHSPSHRECAYYAARVCPFLANTSRLYVSEPPQLSSSENAIRSMLRPDRMGLVCCRKYTWRLVQGVHPTAFADSIRWIDWEVMPISRQLSKEQVDD